MLDLARPENWPVLLAAFAAFAYALLVVLAWSRKRRATAKKGQATAALQTFSAPVAAPSAEEQEANRPVAAPVATTVPAARLATADMAAARPAAAAVPLAETQPKPQPQEPLPQDPVAACSALLGRAKAELDAGRPVVAAGALRDLIKLAASNGLPSEHAAARLELGELARQDGDLITACEHWQIARGLFHDLKNLEHVKATDKRMREHGCPTDWVLNDF